MLGSSSGFPQANRATSGYLLMTGDSLSLIDCGGGVTSSFLRRGFDPLSVDRIFVSHTHSDHVCELPLFLQLLYLSGRQDKITLFLPEEFVDPFRAYLPALYLIEKKLSFEIEFVGYQPGVVYDDLFKLSAIANKHLQSYAGLISELGLPNRMQCHCFSIEVGGSKIFYSADISSFEEVVPYLTDQKVVLIETTHIDLNDLFNHAAQSKVEKFVLTHLGTEEEVIGINQMLADRGIKNIITAVDGLELRL